MLPDVERLARAARLDAFAARLRAIGYDARAIASANKPGALAFDPLRAPLRLWHLRRRTEASAIATRIFFEGDDAREDEARSALGDLAPWIDAGLVESREGRVASRFRIAPFGGGPDAPLVIGDALGAHEDAVMAAGGTTIALARAAIPSARVASACDLGCGAGAIAIAMSRVAGRVVALDVNPRAIALTQINARVNGASNVIAEVSDWFDAARGARFSLVASQPPFAARAEGAANVAFLHGGARGDELPLRALSQIDSHLEDGGLAFVQADWPILQETTRAALVDRMRAAMGERGDLVLFQAPNQDLDEVVAHYAAARHADLGDAFRADALALRDHFERVDVRAVCTALAIVRRAARGFSAQVPVRHAHDAPITRDAVDRFVSAIDLARASDEILDRADLEVAPGVTIADAPDLGDGVRGAIVRAAPPALIQPFALDGDDARALDEIARGARSRDERTRRAARSLLLRGVLQSAR